MLKLSGAVLSAALLVSTFAATPAKAAMSLAVVDNTVSNTAIVSDCAAGSFLCGVFADDKNGNAGQISTTVNQYNGSFVHQHNVNSAQISASGSPVLAQGQLSLTDLDIESAGPTTITVYLTETGLTSPQGLAVLRESLSATSLSGNVTVDLQGFEDNGNRAFYTSGSSTPVISVTPPNTGAAASSIAQSSVINFATPYSLTEVATIHFLTADHLNLNFTGILSAAPVPEPTSVVLFGTILAGASLFMRKRFQANN